MTTTAQIEANRANAQHSTGPKTAEGKARSSQNALKHTLRASASVAIPRGPFAESNERMIEFCAAVIDELDPRSLQERAEAENIAALYVRRARLVELEALALAGATRKNVLPPEAPGMPERIRFRDAEKAAADALSSDLLHQIPRYEGHLSRELDRALARYRGLQRERVAGMCLSSSSTAAS